MAQVPEDIGIAQDLSSRGYFTRVAAGDARAASLFVRLFAYTANPNGNPNGWGWLKKGGGHHIDGYSEDAVVYGSNPSDLHNVVDMVIGTGAPGARLVPSTTVTVPRRPADTWEAPKPLTADEISYLKGFNPGPDPGPGPDPCAAVKAELATVKAELAALKASTVPKVDYEAHGGDPVWDAFGHQIIADYKRAGRVVTTNSGEVVVVLDAQAFRWAGRTMHDDYMLGLSLAESIAKHRVEWCALLGIPVS